LHRRLINENELKKINIILPQLMMTLRSPMQGAYIGIYRIQPRQLDETNGTLNEFINSHTISGHKFKDEMITLVRNTENNFMVC